MKNILPSTFVWWLPLLASSALWLTFSENNYSTSHVVNTLDINNFVDTSNVALATATDNLYICPDKKTVYLYIDLRGKTVGKRIPLNLTVVFDRSGSMEGERIEEARAALSFLIDHLDNSDIFSVVTYDHQAEVLHDAMPVYNHEKLKRRVNGIETRGGTNISAGLQKGFEEVSKGYDSSKINRMFLLTDGLANEGITDEYILEQMVKNYSHKHNTSVSTFGLGHEYNEHLLHDLAEAGGGHFYHIDVPSDVDRDFGQEIRLLQDIVARNADLWVDYPSDKVKVVQVFGQHAVIQRNNIHINMQEIHPNEQTGIMIQFELKKPLTEGDSLNFLTRLSFDDVVMGKHFTEQQKRTVIASSEKFDCDENNNHDVLDKAIHFASNELLESAMRDAEAQDLASARSKVNQTKTLLNTAKDTSNVSDQKALTKVYDNHLDDWHNKSHHDKRVLHKNLRHHSYKIRKNKVNNTSANNNTTNPNNGNR